MGIHHIHPPPPHYKPMQRLAHVGLLPAVHRSQALAKALRRTRDAAGGSDDDDEAPLEEQA